MQGHACLQPSLNAGEWCLLLPGMKLSITRYEMWYCPMQDLALNIHLKGIFMLAQRKVLKIEKLDFRWEMGTNWRNGIKIAASVSLKFKSNDLINVVTFKSL